MYRCDDDDDDDDGDDDDGGVVMKSPEVRSHTLKGSVGGSSI